jgi:2-(3-amino-3-carboxypropyl)histidine synthase
MLCYVSQSVKEALADTFPIAIPQAKPLSRGEILGCTSPRLASPEEVIIYLGDGRFHLESIMIANPANPAYKYDPYAKAFTREGYAHAEMERARFHAITQARGAKRFGLILGTLGRQGSPKVLDHCLGMLREAAPAGITYLLLFLSEITAAKLAAFPDVEAWIQISCPRLSIDWGYAFPVPLLTAYEASVVFGRVPWQSQYPMDFYAKDSLGPWTPNHVGAEARAAALVAVVAKKRAAAVATTTAASRRPVDGVSAT